MSSQTSNPGLSLWLVVAKDDHPFRQSLVELIQSTIPTNFAQGVVKSNFEPHVTVVSGIDASSVKHPQAWLDGLSLPSDLRKELKEATIELERVEAGDDFFRKVTIAAKEDENLMRLAAVCRQQAAQVSEADAKEWAAKEYQPHLSLAYADIAKSEVQKKIPLIELQLGWEFGSLFDCCGGTLAMEAKLALVDTSKSVDEWQILATRQVPWVRWTMARSLI